MQEELAHLVAGWHPLALLGVIAVSVLALGKSADWLVEEAVTISIRAGVPRMVVGATIVSLGTTTPEAVVSVMAAFSGDPEIALGNAVGSIICDTGLILGIAILLRPLPIDRRLTNRQGWVQFGSGVLLVGACVPWDNPALAFAGGGNLPQAAGWVFVGLLVVYLIWSASLARSMSGDKSDKEHGVEVSEKNLAVALLCLLIALAIVIVSSSFLIAAAKELAEQMHVPPSIIAATLVAFGTSLPELVIAVTATLKGHGALAVGNIIGADILNVLFVAGAAASVTPGGLVANAHFFQMQFPAMLFVLLVFRIGIWQAKNEKLSRPFGVILLLTYIVVTVISFVVAPAAGGAAGGGALGH